DFGLCIRIYVVTRGRLRPQHLVLASMVGNRLGGRVCRALLYPNQSTASGGDFCQIKQLLCLRAYPSSPDFYRTLWREPHPWIHLLVAICSGSDTHHGRNGAQGSSKTARDGA